MRAEHASAGSTDHDRCVRSLIRRCEIATLRAHLCVATGKAESARALRAALRDAENPEDARKAGLDLLKAPLPLSLPLKNAGVEADNPPAHVDTDAILGALERLGRRAAGDP